MMIGEYFADLASWRNWLDENHSTHDAIWMRYYKRHTGKPTVAYEDAVQEALCWGWIDSLIKRVDDDIYLRKFSPRNPGSNWSASNRRRARKLIEEGRMQPAGHALLVGVDLNEEPENPTTAASIVPPEVLAGLLAENVRARSTFEALPPSHKRRYIGWIMDAKRDETRRRRAIEAVSMLEKGERLGMK